MYYCIIIILLEQSSRFIHQLEWTIGECGSTLYVGLSGISEPDTKVYGIRPHLFKHFFFLHTFWISQASDK